MNRFEAYTSFRKEGLLPIDGVVVASDISQEWLLAWWWDAYLKHNDTPVTFIDLGLSERARKWCQERGECIKLPFVDFLIRDKDEVSHLKARNWEDKYGENFWQYRKAWFKKPLACLLSPYLRTIWLDLDCEVLGSIKPLFEKADHPSGMGIARDAVASHEKFPIYNSGVIVFRRDVAALSKWAVQALENNEEHRGDQDLLSQILFDDTMEVNEISPLYNWTISRGEDDRIVIFHWVGEIGKEILRTRILEKNCFTV